MKNTKGMSEIVVTLILILLAIVVVGVVWVVVSNVVNNGKQQIESNNKCINAQMSIVQAICTSTYTDCNVTVKNSGSQTVDGFYVIYDSADGTTSTGQMNTSLSTYQTGKITSTFAGGLASPLTKIEVAAMFNDSGQYKPCPQPQASTTDIAKV